jgi:hypothetical protein
MAELLDFDTPLTRLKQVYEEKLLVKDQLIEELTSAVSIANEKTGTVKGVNEMLKLLLLDMGVQVKGMGEQIKLMERNIEEMRSKLPDID